MDCLITWRASGPCGVCGIHQNELHCADDGVYCADHCPVHRQIEAKWDGEPQTVTGEQGGLFG